MDSGHLARSLLVRPTLLGDRQRQHFHNIFDLHRMLGNTRVHGRRRFQGLVNGNEIVMEEVEGD